MSMSCAHEYGSLRQIEKQEPEVHTKTGRYFGPIVLLSDP
jgi:hypothetical protein